MDKGIKFGKAKFNNEINNQDSENLQMKLDLNYSNLKVKIGALFSYNFS